MMPSNGHFQRGTHTVFPTASNSGKLRLPTGTYRHYISIDILGGLLCPPISDISKWKIVAGRVLGGETPPAVLTREQFSITNHMLITSKFGLCVLVPMVGFLNSLGLRGSYSSFALFSDRGAK